MSEVAKILITITGAVVMLATAVGVAHTLDPFSVARLTNLTILWLGTTLYLYKVATTHRVPVMVGIMEYFPLGADFWLRNSSFVTRNPRCPR